MNPYSIVTSDPAVDRAVAYLKTLGAPEPVRTDTVVASPGVNYVDSQLTFTANGKTQSNSAGLTAMYPNVTANDLAEAGIIVLSAPLYPFVPVPGVNIDAFAPPASSPNLPPAPTTPQSPVGPKYFPNQPDIVGDDYYSSPYDTFPVGHVYTDPGTSRSWVKKAYVTLFCNSSYWVRTA